MWNCADTIHVYCLSLAKVIQVEHTDYQDAEAVSSQCVQSSQKSNGENKLNAVDWDADGCCPLCDKDLCFYLQSKKHANKVRRYLSMQNEKEPALKKLKPSSDDSVSKMFSVLPVNVSWIQITVIILFFQSDLEQTELLLAPHQPSQNFPI